VEAANALKERGCSVRAMVVHRAHVQADGELTEVTEKLPLAKTGEGDAWTEEEARAVLGLVDQTPKEAAPAATEGIAPPPSAVEAALDGKPNGLPRPVLFVLWGGIGAGKSTVAKSSLIFGTLIPQAKEDCVHIGVDDLVEFIPEYRAAKESGNEEEKKAAYMQYRDQVGGVLGVVFLLSSAGGG